MKKVNIDNVKLNTQNVLSEALLQMQSNKTAIIIVEAVKNYVLGKKCINLPDFKDDILDKKNKKDFIELDEDVNCEFKIFNKQDEMKEIAAFSHFLGYVMQAESRKNDIDVYTLSRPGEEITTGFENVLHTKLNSVKDISKKYDRYLFCGFHYNMCIKRAMLELNYYDVKKKDMGVIINLSMLAPEVYLSKESPTYFHESGINLFYWSRREYKRVTVLN